MPRKSREVRLSQAKSLMSQYEASPHAPMPTAFVSQMISRLEKGKALSKRQRDWLDTLISDGVTPPKNPELYNKIKSRTGIYGQSERHTQILNDFAGQAYRGYSFSEKQKSFLNRLLAEADELKTSGPWQPDSDMSVRLKNAVLIAQSRSDGYWYNRPGELKAYLAVKKWIDETTDQIPGLVTEWAAKKILKSSRVGLRELDNPTFQPGSIVRYIMSPQPAIIISGPDVSPNQGVCYDLLVEGNVRTARIKDIRKRLKK